MPEFLDTLFCLDTIQIIIGLSFVNDVGWIKLDIVLGVNSLV